MGSLLQGLPSFNKRILLFSLLELFSNCSQPAQFKEDGTRFVGLITKLMERLLDYRTVVLGDDNIDNRMSCTVNVLVSGSLQFIPHGRDYSYMILFSFE